MRIASGLSEGGVVVGNAYDKYGARGPVVRRIMHGFHSALDDLVRQAAPRNIHEVGCGEGYWVLRWRAQGIEARGSDFSSQVIDLARANASNAGVDPELFTVRGIEALNRQRDSADLVVCCEVLEHLEDPDAGLAALQQLDARHLLLSVPREPLWRALNLARGHYVRDLGNTPGHLQHWSRHGFAQWVARRFEVLEVRSPLPWTMLLVRARR